MGDNSFEKIDIQLVFDTNILVDALVSRGSYFHYAVDLLTMVEKGHVEGWYAPHTLTILSDTFVFELRLDYLVHFLVFAPIVLLWRLGFPRHSVWAIMAVGMMLALGLEGGAVLVAPSRVECE